MDRASKVGDKCYTRHTQSLCQHSMIDVSFQRGDSRLFKVRCRGLTPNGEGQHCRRKKQEDQIQEMLDNAKSWVIKYIRGKARDQTKR